VQIFEYIRTYKKTYLGGDEWISWGLVLCGCAVGEFYQIL
jgi:hypothetical protein